SSACRISLGWALSRKSCMAAFSRSRVGSPSGRPVGRSRSTIGSRQGEKQGGAAVRRAKTGVKRRGRSIRSGSGANRNQRFDESRKDGVLCRRPTRQVGQDRNQ